MLLGYKKRLFLCAADFQFFYSLYSSFSSFYYFLLFILSLFFFFNLPTHHCSLFFSFLSAELNASLEICKSFWRHTAVWTMEGSFSEYSNTNSTNLAFQLSLDLRLLMSIYTYYYLQKGLTATHWSHVYSSRPSSMPFCLRRAGWN